MSVSTDLKNAGGKYLDKPVVVDRTLVTSRFPADLPDSCREALKLLAQLYSSTVMAPVGHEVTHAIQRMQSSALTGTDF